MGFAGVGGYAPHLQQYRLIRIGMANLQPRFSGLYGNPQFLMQFTA